MNTNQVELIEKFGNKVDGYLQVLAEKLGQSAEHFWPVFVRQQVIDGLSSLVTWVFFMGIALLALRWGMREGNRYSWKGDDSSFGWAATIVSSIALIIFAIIGVCNAGGTFSQIFNPEYSALTEIVRMVR